MNERVMQFRIGLFVIVAGLVLTMLIVWFGETPGLLRDIAYLQVHFLQAPGVSEGIPVRKSGIRIGEITSIKFDDRPRVRGKVEAWENDRARIRLADDTIGTLSRAQLEGRILQPGSEIDVIVARPARGDDPAFLVSPDGILVLLTLDRKYRLASGSIPRLNRAIIGDVSLDILPGDGPGLMETGTTPGSAPIIEGQIAADPSSAIELATGALQNVPETLKAIEEAAKGLAVITSNDGNVQTLLTDLKTASQKVGALAEDVDQVIKANEAEIPKIISSLRKAADTVNATLDENTRQQIRETVTKLSSASDRIDSLVADIQPLARDLAAGSSAKPTTSAGELLARVNRIAYDISVLTQPISDGKGGLNMNGSLQKILSSSELYDSFAELANNLNMLSRAAGPVLRNINEFSKKVAADPSIISRGVLRQ
jgi:phospholipid/cholesterol/gamma-HCH transport system substrate-binding protein